MDLFGPVTYLSIRDNKYGLVIIDDYSRFTWVFFLHDKCQVQEKMKIFVRRAQKEFGLPNQENKKRQWDRIEEHLS